MFNSRYLLIFLLISLTRACEIFNGMTCTCYESMDLRCTMFKLVPFTFQSPLSRRTFQTIDLKFPSDQMIDLYPEHFVLLNQLLANETQHPLTITLRFQNFNSFHGRTASFSRLFEGISTRYSRLIIELHPLKAKSIHFDSNIFEKLKVDELSIYADSFSSPFESIFNNTDVTHLNIEGAIVAHDPSLVGTFHGRIQSLKMTRMIDAVNSEEFPPFPVQSYIIEAHKMRTLDARSFFNYSQLTGLNIIQPDVSITSKLFNGLEYLTNLRSLSLDAERIAEGALKHVRQIETLILGSYLKLIDEESLNSLRSLRQLDVRYVQFSSLQVNASCLLADFINRRRMLNLNVYLPLENLDCDCVLLFLNAMIDQDDETRRCQSIQTNRCLFSSCPMVSEYFNRQVQENRPVQSLMPIAHPPSIESSAIPPDSPFYPDSREESTTIQISMEANIYDNEEEDENAIIDIVELNSTQLPSITTTKTSTTTTVTTTTTTIGIIDTIESEFSTPVLDRFQLELKSFASTNYLIVSWIPFAIVAVCLFLTLITAMIGYVIYHKRRTVSFKLVPQNAPII